MGAAKLPEQIDDRIEAGRREMLEGEASDPIIQKLKAQPVNRDIKPEEHNQRRAISPGAAKGTRTIANRLALQQRLRALYHKIDTLRSNDPMMVASGRKALAEQIASLREQARGLRKDINRLKKRKRSKPRA